TVSWSRPSEGRCFGWAFSCLPRSSRASFRHAWWSARIRSTRFLEENNMIEVKNLKKSFKDGEQITEVLKGIDFTARDGEFVAIMGRSGAGKSTFLYQMSLLDESTEGEISINGQDTHSMSPALKTDFRLS